MRHWRGNTRSNWLVVRVHPGRPHLRQEHMHRHFTSVIFSGRQTFQGYLVHIRKILHIFDPHLSLENFGFVCASFLRHTGRSVARSHRMCVDLPHLEQFVNLRQSLLSLLLNASAVVVRHLTSKINCIAVNDCLAHVWVIRVEPCDLKRRGPPAQYRYKVDGTPPATFCVHSLAYAPHRRWSSRAPGPPANAELQTASLA
eukprot:COSAG02_NODE_1253_length_13598_cov_3.599526_3_plen_200_part_00